MAHALYISDVTPSTKEEEIRAFFQGVTNVVLGYDHNGKYLRHARVSFATPQALHEALQLSGHELDGRPAIISVFENLEFIPLYVFVKEIAPDTKNDVQILNYFRSADVNVREPVVYRPLDKDYAFVYVTSSDHWRHCLSLDDTIFYGKRISVRAGVFSGKRGRRSDL